MEYMYFVLSYVILLLMVIFMISFITLLERSMLGILQDRKGPNKVGIGGILQPVGDGVKLLTKEVLWIFKTNFWVYLLSPIFSMGLMMMAWVFYPFLVNFLKISEMGFVFLVCILGLGVYSFILSGWSSNSIYSIFGGIRAISQTISYEVSLIFVVVNQFLCMSSLNLGDLLKFQDGGFFFMLLFMYMYWLLFLIILADLNRTPFDLVEGESELVSGFNIEYLGGLFALVFLAEYGMILFLSMFIVMMYSGGSYTFLFMMVFLKILWVRGILPRVRYDKLMSVVWKGVLPVSMNLLILTGMGVNL